jgi:hypothetical protein
MLPGSARHRAESDQHQLRELGQQPERQIAWRKQGGAQLKQQERKWEKGRNERLLLPAESESTAMQPQRSMPHQ